MTTTAPQGVTETHTTVIDGLTYTASTLPTTRALALLPKLAAVLGSDGLELLMRLETEAAEAATPEAKSAMRGALTASPETIAPLFTFACANADAAGGFSAIALEILQNTRCTGIRIGDNAIDAMVHEHFDRHFKGRLMHLFHVCVWAAQASFDAL
jgi:hypothetical protein